MSDSTKVIADALAHQLGGTAESWLSCAGYIDEQASLLRQVPEGYVLVPCKITEAMCDACHDVPAGIAGSPPHPQWIWDAMIAAAPKANPAPTTSSKGNVTAGSLTSGAAKESEATPAQAGAELPELQRQIDQAHDNYMRGNIDATTRDWCIEKARRDFYARRGGSDG